jgi:hypothetical protein
MLLLGESGAGKTAVSAAVTMNVEDYYKQGKRFWFRLHEKGGKFHEVPAHHSAEEYLDTYIAAGKIADDRKSPLFRSARCRGNVLANERMSRTDVLRIWLHLQLMREPGPRGDDALLAKDCH